MRKILLLLLPLSCLLLTVSAQENPFSTVVTGSLPARDKIYLHCDKRSYVAGDTLWFRAYIHNTDSSIGSTGLYVEMMNDSGAILHSLYLPVIGNSAFGNIEFPLSMPSGIYFIRAYTAWMLNFRKNLVCYKAFAVFNPAKPLQRNLEPAKNFEFSMYPESGNIISNVLNIFAFRATNKTGNAISTEGNIEDSQGNIICSFKEKINGMGKFGFIPLEDEKYTAVIKFPDQSVERRLLPAAKSTGALLQLTTTVHGQSYHIIITDDSYDNISLKGIMNNQIVFEENIGSGKKDERGNIPTMKMPSGILSLVLTDGNNHLLAERNVFINNHEYSMPVIIRADTINFKARAKNSIRFSFAGNITGNFSLSVTDADKETGPVDENPAEALLYSADFTATSPIRQLENKDQLSAEATDLLAITEMNSGNIIHNWTGSKLQKETRFIELKGRVTDEKGKKPLTEGSINFLLRLKDSALRFTEAPIERNGRFSAGSMIFQDTAKVYYQVRNRKNRYTTGTVIPDTALAVDNRHLQFPEFDLGVLYNKYFSDSAGKLKITGYYDDIVLQDKKYRSLHDIVIWSKKKNPAKEVNDEYASGLFSAMGMPRIYDFINNPPPEVGMKVIDYMRTKIAGVIFQQTGLGQYKIYTLRNVSILGGPAPVKVYLNEVQQPDNDLSQVAFLPVNDIALIKYFPPGTIQLVDAGFGGTLVIYTKKGKDVTGNAYEKSLINFYLKGYSPVRDFYSPAYNGKEQVPDYRATLLWVPEIILNEASKEFKMSFFNSNDTKKIRVTINGITGDGKIVHAEKIIE